MKYVLVSLMLCAAGALHAADWPREIKSSEGTVTLYEPQLYSYSEDSLKARVAVSVTPVETAKPVFGAVWLDCRVLTDRPSRTVALHDVHVRQIRFPSGSNENTAKISAILEKGIPRWDLTFSLDELLESIDLAQKERESARDLDMVPPRIIMMDRPAVLLLIDGDPIFMDVGGTSLKRVVNTPYFLVEDPSSGLFYLKGGDIWYSASRVLGPWRQTTTPPQVAVDIAEETTSDADSATESEAQNLLAKTGKVPEIVVSTEPAELIATDGPIQFSPIGGTGLLYASNTPSRLFLEIATQQYYIVISGRWCAAPALTGPWTYVAADKLPADFADIPPGSECDDVLASVPGTLPAKEAILDAQIPQTAEVDRMDAASEVQYDGDPQFEPMEGTEMEYALNASSPVIRVRGRYYDCDRGIWFQAASAMGPWVVCVDVPPVIYTISPRYPVYYVRYVRVYSYTPTVVYVGYTSGYTGCYVYNRRIVYGTGYHYRSWFRHYYYPRPWTWGFNVHYHPWAGWSMAYSRWWRQPRAWFAYSRGGMNAGWWGPDGYIPVYRPSSGPVYRNGYHPVYQPPSSGRKSGTTVGGGTRSSGASRTPTVYDGWKKGVRRPPETARSVQARDVRKQEQVSRAQPKARTTDQQVEQTVPVPAVQPKERTTDRQAESPPPVPAVQPRTRTTDTRNEQPAQERTPSPPRLVPRSSGGDNNVYAAPDGNILRKTSEGWQQRDQNTWKDAGQAPATSGVDRDAQVRQRAAERASSFSPPSPAPPAPKVQPKETTRKEGEKR